MMAIYRYEGPKKARELVIDDVTALWLARMVVGEGGRYCGRAKAVALIWAIINRYMLWGGRWRYRSFVRLMRAFSQPINPRWMTGGDLAKKYIGRSAASAQRLKRRARICALTWDAIPRRVRQAVRDAQAGTLERPAIVIEKRRINNWASLKSTPKKFPWGCDIDGDWFFEERNTLPGKVVIETRFE